MALFRRLRPEGPGAGIARFWSWWDAARDDVGAAIGTPRLGALLDEPVRGVHPSLLWQAARGRDGRNRLALSGARHPALRVVTQRWRDAGPPDDAQWEYHPALPPDPGAFTRVVRLGAVELEPARATALVQVDAPSFRIDVDVHHPAFTELDELTAGTLAHELVGLALGEDDCERWVGRVGAATVPPLDAVPVAMLGAITSQLAERWGGERWALLEGSFGANRLIAAVRHPLHRVDHPRFDEHLAVRLPYTEAGPDGLPTERAMTELKAFEELVTSRLGADALLVAHQTAAGERLLHFYADSTASPVEVVRQMLAAYLGGFATVQAEFDPGWELVSHLRQ